MAGTTEAPQQHDGGSEPDEAGVEAPVAGAVREEHLSDLPVRPRARGLLLAVGGAIGFLASMVLTVERFRLAADPSYTPSCSISPFISCQTVMTSSQAALFGFPNPLIGVAAFPVAVTLGMLLLARTPLPRWVERGFLAGIGLGMVFIGWLVSQALYSIHALCPYCMVVWVVVTALFWTCLADGLDRGLVPVPAALRPVARAVVDYRVLLIIVTLVAIVAMIGVAFWSYWVTLL